MLLNHSAWSWNKDLSVLINVPVVKLLSVGKNPTANVCKTHNTGQNCSKIIQVSLSALDILTMKYITKTSLSRGEKKKKKDNSFWFISPLLKKAASEKLQLILPTVYNLNEKMRTAEFSMWLHNRKEKKNNKPKKTNQTVKCSSFKIYWVEQCTTINH